MDSLKKNLYGEIETIKKELATQKEDYNNQIKGLKENIESLNSKIGTMQK